MVFKNSVYLKKEFFLVIGCFGVKISYIYDDDHELVQNGKFIWEELYFCFKYCIIGNIERKFLLEEIECSGFWNINSRNNVLHKQIMLIVIANQFT